MRILFYLILLALAKCGSSGKPVKKSGANTSVNTKALRSYQRTITPEYLRKQLSTFAADSMEGRETAMPGQKKAARFLANQYRALGLKPAGKHDSYFQKFGLTAKQLDSVVFETYINYAGQLKKIVHKSVNSKNTSANYIRQFGGDLPARGDIVFAGYGIQDQVLNIDQLKGVDLKGKWVLIFRDNIPTVIQGDTLYTNFQRFARITYGKIIQKGVAGILAIPDMTEQAFDRLAEAQQQRFNGPTGMQLTYRAHQQNKRSWSYDVIRPREAAKILKLQNGIAGLKKLKHRVNKHMKTFTNYKTDFGLKQIPYNHQTSLESENVAAYLPGGDPKLSNQLVILSAHYDHLGIGSPDSTGDRIYNGANDDGSGTIGVLSAARAFAKAREKGVRPRRSILFLSVAGEEKGLLGSRYYSDHPIYPINNTIADINTDMIGRVDPKHQQIKEPDYIYVIGASIISSDIDSLMRAGNARAGKLALDMRYNDLDDPNQFYRRSDHWNFGRLGIPFVFFFNGVNKDYHQPSDEVNKINFDLMAKTARTIYATTIEVANADSVPKIDNQAFIEATKE